MRESFQRRNRNQTVTDDPSSRISNDEDSGGRTPNSHSTQHSESTEGKCKERFGLLKSFKRRLTLNFRRKSEESTHETNIIEDHYMTVPVKRHPKKNRHKSRCKVPICDLSSKSNSSSHSCDSLDLNLAPNNVQKLNDMHNNTEAYDLCSRKEKASCRSKDFTKFHPVERTKVESQVLGSDQTNYNISKETAPTNCSAASEKSWSSRRKRGSI